MSSVPAYGPNVPAVPFAPDGGCSPIGWVLMLGASTLAGATMGLVAGFISQWFYLVLLFPLGMGMLIGAAGAWAIKQGKVRSPWLTVFAGCLGGAATCWGMHFCEYQLFLHNRSQEVSAEDLQAMIAVADNFDQLKQNPAALDENLRDFVQFLQDNPEALASLRVKNFWDFVDLGAQQGVTISKAGGGGGKGINLGYVGSYIYWGVEWAIIAGLAIAFMWPAAGEPYCLNCQNWKTWQPLGCITPDQFAAKDALSNGDLTALSNLSPVACVGPYMVTAAVCTQCGEQSPADLKLEHVTVNEKNEPVRQKLLLVTYPGEALPLIRQMFDDGAARAIAEAEAAEAAEAQAAGEQPQTDQDPSPA